MALTLTNPTLSTTFDSTESDANFADVTAKFNGNITNADIDAGASIATSKLAARDYEFLVHFAPQVWGTTGQVIDAVGLPYDGTADGYTILGGEYFLMESSSAQSPTFDIDFGYFSGAVWQNSATIVNEQAMTANTDETGDVTIGTSTVTLDSNQNFFRLKVGAVAGANFLNGIGANEMLRVTLKTPSHKRP